MANEGLYLTTMKMVGKSLLVILFIPLFIIFLAATSVRFQLLNQNFYIGSFEKHSVYQQTSDNLKNLIVESYGQEAVSSKQIKTYTDLLTPDTLKLFIEKNIQNIFNFLNYQTPELTVYIPIDKIPATLLPPNFVLKQDSVPLSTFMGYFGRPGATIDPIFLQRARLVMTGSFVLWVVSLLLVIGVLIFQAKLTEKDKRYVSPAVTLIIAGVVSLIAIVIINLLKSTVAEEWAMSVEPSQILFGPIVFSLVSSILTLWTYMTIAAIFLGGAFLFFKKEVLVKKNV